MICIEGIDGTGKTTLIKQLQEKYPDKIETLAFPTPEARKELDRITWDTTYDNLARHMIFEMDFVNTRYYLNGFRDYGFSNKDKALLLDRWYPSNIAYAKFEFRYSRFYREFYEILRN